MMNAYIKTCCKNVLIKTNIDKEERISQKFGVKAMQIEKSS